MNYLLIPIRIQVELNLLGLLPAGVVGSSVTERCGYAPSSRLATSQNSYAP
jgi:hypothetical protein